ncbi:MAG: hypothetical protein MZV49_16825 [Rhodopseudomonas palustris]|nr:hypothetical protein [Rhodopseudomonas palustris]
MPPIRRWRRRLPLEAAAAGDGAGTGCQAESRQRAGRAEDLYALLSDRPPDRRDQVSAQSRRRRKPITGRRSSRRCAPSARKLHATQMANPKGGAPAIDPDSQRKCNSLSPLAMPLLFQLREDQKQEVRSLARIIGLHQVAAAI